jgi:hypothetical protein
MSEQHIPTQAPVVLEQHESQFDEIWIELPDGQSLCALINGNVGWLMYLPESDDVGFHSHNPAHKGSPDAEIEYELSNGQQDLYPASWALPIEIIREALAYFEREGQRPPFIAWVESNGDD